MRLYSVQSRVTRVNLTTDEKAGIFSILKTVDPLSYVEEITFRRSDKFIDRYEISITVPESKVKELLSALDIKN